jgi:CO dehydrogenase nickel-insertion accessory protein CooC1
MRLNPLHVARGQLNKSNHLRRVLIFNQLNIVGSKIHDDADSDFVESISPELDIIGYLPVDARVIEADQSGIAIFKLSPYMVTKGIKITKFQINDKGQICF